MDNRKCNEYIGAITVCTSQLVTLKQLKRLWPLPLQTLQRRTQIDMYIYRERERVWAKKNWFQNLHFNQKIEKNVKFHKFHTARTHSSWALEIHIQIVNFVQWLPVWQDKVPKCAEVRRVLVRVANEAFRRSCKKVLSVKIIQQAVKVQ